LPQLATSSGHRVTATWLDGRRRIVVENWSPTGGWSKPVHLSDRSHTAWNPQIVSNAAGMVAISWSQQAAGFKNPQFAMVAVRRHGSWAVKQVGRMKASGSPPGAVVLGMAADGAVTAAWENVPPGDDHPEFLARRLPAGTGTWEPAHDFGSLFGEYFDYDRVALAVQPDGSEMLSRPLEFSLDHQVFTRVGDGEWIDGGVQPFGGFGGGSLSLPSGALVTWMDQDVFEDPDGIAGPAPFSNLGQLLAHSLFTKVVATSDGTLVQVARRVKRIVYAVHPPGGDWSAEQTAYRTTRNTPTVWSVSTSADGQVTVLFGTRPAGSSGHHPLRMETIRFDATPPT
jgi:hypothetical protein